VSSRAEGDRKIGRPGVPDRVVARLRRDVPLVVLDLVSVLAAYLTILVIRFDGAVPSHYWANFWAFLPAVAFFHLMGNYLCGLYGQMWRYASIREARQVVVAGASGTLLTLGVNLAFGSARPLPLSVVVLGSGLAAAGVGAVRFQSRLFAWRRRVALSPPTRVLLVGAGEAGTMVLKDIVDHPELGLDPVALVDDDPRKVSASLRGVRVAGNRSAIPGLVARLQVDEVLLAIPSATSDVVRDVAAACEEAAVVLRVLPSVREVVGGRVTARDLRDLRIEDLLGRQQVETDIEAVAAIVAGRRVLVTGAGGSIGSEIAHQIAALHPGHVLLLDHDETHLHDVQVDLDGSSRTTPILGDVRDRDRMFDVLCRHRPHVVFHAAADKHVPLLETHPEEAVLTNVLGTANVADAAVAAGVERFVLISTDKAVNPVSVMGASKRFAEQVVRSLHGSGSVFCAVRFGNVLGSRGSVIPTFFRQIARGGPVTVTDPRMRRFFMSVEEAVRLVLQAAAFSTGGEVFTLDMGAPINILDLARKLIRLSGRVPGRDIPVVIVGPRPGEKLEEDIVALDEVSLPSPHPSITVSRPPIPDPALLRRAIREMETLIGRDGDGLGPKIKELAGRSAVPVAEREAT
jgi:FlaA1/EpsC-like NDP-sugar epimerase